MRRLGLLAVGCLFGCQPDWSDRIPQTKPLGQLMIEPSLVSGVSSRAVRVWSSVGENPRLFALALSESQLASVRRGEPSQAVIEHEVPLLETQDEDEDDSTHVRAWAVSGLLAPSTSYTAVSETAHLKFITTAVEPALERVWPRSVESELAVYCASSSVGLGPLGANPEVLWGNDRIWFGADAGSGLADAGLEPPDTDWALLGGPSPCFLWQGKHGGTLPPMHWNGFAVEPLLTSDEESAASGAMVTRGPSSEAPAIAACSADEVAIEQACVTVLDDRVVVRPITPDTLWFASGDGQGWFVSERAEPGVIRGLVPDTPFVLSFATFAASGSSVRSELATTAAASGVHVVINEVLADPLGAEPQGEWIEIYNDGPNVADLAGWALADDSGSIQLPALQLAPFGYALLVNDTYERTSELDVVPDEDVFLIRLPSLGKSGLSNQGETLHLVDNSGKVVSSFPATPKPTTGVSVARREPWFMGAQARAFGLHAAPYASPGKPNSIGF